MSQTRDSVTSVVITVAFLVLISIATVLYGGNAEQKAKMENNFLWQKTRLVFDTGLYLLSGVTNVGGSNGSSSSAVVSNTTPTSDPSLWSKIVVDLKDAWDKSGEKTESSQMLTSGQPLASENGSFLTWEKTATGAAIIFKGKSGKAYKLDLPFKFLSQ